MIGLLFGLEIARKVLESLGLLVLVNGTQEHKVRFLEALELTVEGFFVGQLIPITAAGVPYQAYLLTRKGVRVGWATALVLVKSFVPAVFFLLVLVAVVVVAALGWEGPAGSLTFLKVVGPLSALPTGTIIALLVIMLRYPKLFDRLLDLGASYLARRLKGRAGERIEALRERMQSESHVFRECLSTLGRPKRWVLVWGALLVVLSYIAEFLVAAVILWGFGSRAPLVGSIMLQCLLKPILSASPTPGSVAVGEVGYIGLFAAYLPAYYVGVSLVLWRLVLYFAPMLVGGTMVARRIGRRAPRARVDREEPLSG